ncbi:MAG: histidine phosphatase family protein, partial [Gammaproteobacteria bacterium]
MSHILFIRHGPTDWNETGRIQGRTDMPLSEG